MKTIKYLIISVIVLSYTNLFSQNDAKDQIRTKFCDGTKIFFDVSALDSIYMHPKEVLSHVKSFWASNAAYRHLKTWYDYNNIGVPYDWFEKGVKEIANLTPEEAKNHNAFKAIEKIFANEKKFNEKAIPHIAAFLPKSTPSIETMIFFKAIVGPHAFSSSSKPMFIGIDPASEHFHDDADFILNILVHEVFHQGFIYTTNNRTEFTLENRLFDRIVNELTEEGLATYVAYTAQNIFPSKSDPDYAMLENDQEVKRQIENVNFVFSKHESLPADSLGKLSFEIGVMQRAYYITGAYMAKVIDEKLGRDSLISAISIGPRHYIHTYNTLVKDNRRIIEFKLPSKISDYQYLRIAMIKKDIDKLKQIGNDLIQKKGSLPQSLEAQINDLGYAAPDSEIAIELFTLNVKLFPNSANAFDSLGEAYMIAGNKELAIKNYEKSLELNPQNTNAVEQLKKLR